MEKSEKRKDARTTREIEVALPNELSFGEQIELVREYVIQNFIYAGMCADISIHAGHNNNRRVETEDEYQGDIIPNNPHAHILLTTRTVSKNGFGQKNREWDKRENVLKWRESWAVFCNREFERRNIDVKIDHRSFEERGITDIQPTIHLGAAASRLEAKGIRTEKGNINRAIKRRNEELKWINAELSACKNELRRLDWQKWEYERAERKEWTGQKRDQQTQKVADDVHQATAELKNVNIASPTISQPAAKSIAVKSQVPEQLTTSQPSVASQSIVPTPLTTIPQPTILSPEEIALAATAESFGKKLAELKDEYIKSVLNAFTVKDSKKHYEETIPGIDATIKYIKKSVTEINDVDKRIKALQQELSQKLFWQGKAKKDIGGQIEFIEFHKNEAIKYLTDCGTDKLGANEKIKELKKMKTDIKYKKAQLPSDATISERQRQAAWEYKKYLILLKLRTDKSEVVATETTHTDKTLLYAKESDGWEVKSTKSKLSRELTTVLPEEYIKIKLSLPTQIKAALNRLEDFGNQNNRSRQRQQNKVIFQDKQKGNAKMRIPFLTESLGRATLLHLLTLSGATAARSVL